MDDRSSAIEEIIRQAQAKGEFENLSGQGRPLDLRENLFAPDSQLAHNLIQNNGFTLPWIADKQEITAELENWRRKLSAAWRQRLNGPTWEQHWRESAATFTQEAAQLNKRILNYNLKVPAASQQLLPVNVELELERARQTPPDDNEPLPQQRPTAVAAPTLRERARAYIHSFKLSRRA